LFVISKLAKDFYTLSKNNSSYFIIILLLLKNIIIILAYSQIYDPLDLYLAKYLIIIINS